MSQFDRYTSTEYVEGLRVFLGLRKEGFLKSHGFLDENAVPKKGRLPRHKDEPVDALGQLVNAKAARAEAPNGSSLGERIRIAKDYLSMTDMALSRKMGVSRELVRRWGENLNRPGDLHGLAVELDVPVAWLVHGGESALPANSHIGVRVGSETTVWREQLYSMTLAQLDDIPEAADVEFIQAHLEWAVFNHAEMATIARRSGGRWQADGKTLVFVPWVPIEPHRLSRRYWSDAVESIIEAELVEKASIYSAWHALRQRCEAMGLSPDEYPTKISLYKRVEKEKQRMESFGVDLNQQIKQSVIKYRTH
jgi:hypothetical protein